MNRKVTTQELPEKETASPADDLIQAMEELKRSLDSFFQLVRESVEEAE